MAIDRLENESYRALTPEDVFELAASASLTFDPAMQTGVVFHMARALAIGRIGVTAVADSVDGAADLHRRVVELLDHA